MQGNLQVYISKTPRGQPVDRANSRLFLSEVYLSLLVRAEPPPRGCKVPIAYIARWASVQDPFLVIRVFKPWISWVARLSRKSRRNSAVPKAAVILRSSRNCVVIPMIFFVSFYLFYTNMHRILGCDVFSAASATLGFPIGPYLGGVVCAETVDVSGRWTAQKWPKTDTPYISQLLGLSWPPTQLHTDLRYPVYMNEWWDASMGR